MPSCQLPAAGEHLRESVAGGQNPLCLRNVHNAAALPLFAAVALQGQGETRVQAIVSGWEAADFDDGVLPVCRGTAEEQKGLAVQEYLHGRNAAVIFQIFQSGQGRGACAGCFLDAPPCGHRVAVLEKWSHERVQAVCIQLHSSPDAGKIGISGDVNAQIPGVPQAGFRLANQTKRKLPAFVNRGFRRAFELPPHRLRQGQQFQLLSQGLYVQSFMQSSRTMISYRG